MVGYPKKAIKGAFYQWCPPLEVQGKIGNTKLK